MSDLIDEARMQSGWMGRHRRSEDVDRRRRVVTHSSRKPIASTTRAGLLKQCFRQARVSGCVSRTLFEPLVDQLLDDADGLRTTIVKMLAEWPDDRPLPRFLRPENIEPSPEIKRLSAAMRDELMRRIREGEEA